MIITKYAKQKTDLLKSRQPDLYKTMQLHFSQLPKSVEELQGMVAGICIEYVLKSQGNEVVFKDEFDAASDEADETDGFFMID